LLVRSLRSGADKSDLAGRFGVSVETITRLLRTEVGLHAAWKSARLTAARGRARSAWEELCAGHVGIGVKLLRAMDPASYAWLYRNDRAWLMEHLPDRGTLAKPTRQGSVRWDERDLRLSAEVRQAAARFAANAGRQAMQLWQIYQLVPQLKPKLRALDRLPLTRQALEDALARRLPRTTSDLFPEIGST
jgi:hypothetical protein